MTDNAGNSEKNGSRSSFMESLKKQQQQPGRGRKKTSTRHEVDFKEDKPKPAIPIVSIRIAQDPVLEQAIADLINEGCRVFVNRAQYCTYITVHKQGGPKISISTNAIVTYTF